MRVRTYPSGRRVIQIHFTYRRVVCRESFKGLDPDNISHWNHACPKKQQIMAEIELGTFNYADHFPDAPRARLFGHASSSTTVKEVAEAWFADVERAYPHSTAYNYRRGLDCFLLPALGDRPIASVTVEDMRQLVRLSSLRLKTIRNYLTAVRVVANGVR